LLHENPYVALEKHRSYASSIMVEMSFKEKGPEKDFRQSINEFSAEFHSFPCFYFYSWFI